jgi:tetratricopeptide (TPR) repeat protein
MLLAYAPSAQAQVPQKILDLLEAGMTAVEDCRISDAGALFDRAVGEAEPDGLALPHALVYRGVIREWQNDLQGSLADHGAALALDPTLLEAYENRIYTYDKLGETALGDADQETHARLALEQDRELDRRRVAIERPGAEPVRLNFLGEKSYGFRSPLHAC